MKKTKSHLWSGKATKDDSYEQRCCFTQNFLLAKSKLTRDRMFHFISSRFIRYRFVSRLKHWSFFTYIFGCLLLLLLSLFCVVFVVVASASTLHSLYLFIYSFIWIYLFLCASTAANKEITAIYFVYICVALSLFLFYFHSKCSRGFGHEIAQWKRKKTPNGRKNRR